MKRLKLLLLLCGFSSVLLLAHGEEKTGVLVDSRCGVDLSADSAKTEAHTTSCALKCQDSGFGIVTGGKFLRFDDFGNKQALLLLKATQKESNLKVRVGGHFEGDLIKVSEIETVE